MTNTPTKDELEDLREDYTREEIAEMYGCSVSQVKRWISSLGVKKKINRNSKGLRRQIPKVPEPAFDSGLPLMDKAKLRLGDRMKEKNGSYWLDNRPATTARIVEAAGLSRSG
jgi:uncharacterized protein YjcR